MRYLIFFLLAACSLFFTGCGRAPEVLIDSFEGNLTSETVDFGSSSDSSVSVEASKDLKKCGQQAIKINYDLSPSGYMWVARGFNLDVEGAAKWLIDPSDIKWHKYNAISVQVYGADSGAVIALDIKDAESQMWRCLFDDNFKGWKKIVCPFSDFFARRDWQPQQAKINEKIDFPVTSFQFEPRLPGQGSYCFDCVKLENIR